MNERDYTLIPGFENMTPHDARINYLNDLMKQYKGQENANTKDPSDMYCRRQQNIGCDNCTFRKCLGRPIGAGGCCGWDAEANPDWAILCLEELLSREKEMEVIGKHVD